jgi:hypothetical protein
LPVSQQELAVARLAVTPFRVASQSTGRDAELYMPQAVICAFVPQVHSWPSPFVGGGEATKKDGTSTEKPKRAFA